MSIESHGHEYEFEPQFGLPERLPQTERILWQGAPDAGTLAQAVALAAQAACPGDAVLLSPACASFDMFDDYAHRARVFVDAVTALTQTSGSLLEAAA